MKFNSLSPAILRCVFIGSVLFVLSACSIESLIDFGSYLVSSTRRSLSVAEARDTFLLKSSKLFYPNGIPEDPSVLPQLTPDDLTEIQQMLAGRIRQIQNVQDEHSALLERNFLGFQTNRPETRLIILSQGSAVAATESTGRVFIDAKVIQAMYRSALLSALVTDREQRSIEEREKLAFAEFAEFSQKLDDTSSSALLSDISGFFKGAQGDGSFSKSKGGRQGFLGTVMGGMFGVLENRLDEMGLIMRSNALEQSFLGAIEFLLAHETAHLVLGHYSDDSGCEAAQQREFDADRYAVFINTLTEFDRRPPLGGS